jgi:hypothetical protein
MTLFAPATRQSEFDRDLQLRRALLRAAQDGAVAQDDVDCAELAFACGRCDVARMLYGLVILRIGFSRPGLAFQREVGERTGLWGDLSGEIRGPVRPVAGFSVDLAIDELRALMALKPDFGATPAGLSPVLLREAQAEPGAQFEATLASLCQRVSATLQAVPQLEANGNLPEELRGLAGALQDLPHIRLDAYVDQSIERLATLHALIGLREFILDTRLLIAATGPSAPLFQEAGRLGPAALGPYFANLRLIIRSARDIFALIESATQNKLTHTELQSWCVLLSGRLPVAELLDLIDELGDRGMTQALAILLAAVSQRPPQHRWREVAYRIRDCCLDIGELVLGAEAQHLIASRDPTNSDEWAILGEIRGTLGDKTAAEQAFDRCLRLNPRDEVVKQRLDALRSGAFDRFKVRGGLMTSPGRRRLRQARAQAYRSKI